MIIKYKLTLKIAEEIRKKLIILKKRIIKKCYYNYNTIGILQFQRKNNFNVNFSNLKDINKIISIMKKIINLLNN